MRFDCVIGNPPYQGNQQENNTYAPPVYHLFIDQAKRVGNCTMLITPARWMFDAGGTPAEWNKQAVSDPHFTWMHYWVDASEVFPTVTITGGLVITSANRLQTFKPIGFFTQYAIQQDIVNKVKNHPDFKSCNAWHYTHQHSKNSEFNSNCFKVEPHLFTTEPQRGDDVRILGRLHNKREWRYTARAGLITNGNWDTFKVIIPAAGGDHGLSQTVIGKPMIGHPDTGYNQSFIGLGRFNQTEAERCLRYIRTRFARAMLKVKKVTHQCKKNNLWDFVPQQDFSDNSDINWGLSIDEIDNQLYNKYQLLPDEVEFIKATVLPLGEWDGD